jgi:tRNA-specific 2-thiouridylase
LFIVQNNKVIIGLSGGVDSSVAAALLIEQGYEVVAATITPIKFTESCRASDNAKSCCSYSSTIDAANISETLGIRHILMDLSGQFNDTVINNFIAEYIHGRTPNPCVLCNRLIKWQELLNKADAMGFDMLATGHYARIRHDESTGRFVISKGRDLKKDQTYVLWKLTQEQIARTIFPLAELTKTETREIARKYNLTVSEKRDSQEICFVTDNNYHNFLNTNIPDVLHGIGKGDLVFHDKIIGKHEGYPYYTIGQRRGLGVSNPEPLYVKSIDPKNNVVEVGLEDELYSSNLLADNVNLIKYSNLNTETLLTAKIRYKDEGSPAKCFIDEDGFLHVEFLEPKKAITAGQSVVLYEGEELVGGGIIL